MRKYILCILVLVLIATIGCASFGLTKPNIPFSGLPYPTVLEELAQKKTPLVQEIGKLPEIQDGISESEKAALEKIIGLYNSKPEQFNEVFKEMYQIGKPDIRKYCSPLQAIFWLSEDGKIDELSSVIADYSLKSLLTHAWQLKPERYHYKGEYLDFTEQEAKNIISNLSKEKQVIFSRLKPEMINKVLLVKYREDSSFLPRRIRSKIKSSIKETKNHVRWKDFKVVRDRINSPELFHCWVSDAIVYRRVSIGKSLAHQNTPRHTFYSGYGDCVTVLLLGRKFLYQSGYKVKSLKTAGIAIGSPSHFRGYIEENDLYKIIIDFGPYGNHIRPPTKSLEGYGKSAADFFGF